MDVSTYWARIKQIPIYLERDTADGDACLGRTRNNDPCRVEKPDRYTKQEREALIEFYEMMYGVATS